jgi:hypothetical protein
LIEPVGKVERNLQLRSCVIFFICHVLTACCPEPIVPGDLVGEYEFDNECSAYQELSSALRARQPSLVLSKDGRFEVKDWSASFLFTGYSKDSLVSGEGRWSLVTYEGSLQLGLSITSFSAGLLHGHTWAMHMQIKRDSDGITLWDWYGDPDQATRIEFKRQE